MQAHPVQLVVEDDLRRNRLTVFFRLLLAIPHYIWVVLWSIATFFVAIVTWVITLFAGEPPAALHRFICSYIRYVTHLEAYLHLVGNPYPGFVGEEGEYPIDLRLPEPGPQNRWKTLFRMVLVLPALLVSSVLLGGGSYSASSSNSGGKASSSGTGGLATAIAVLGWFASLVRGQMPKGLRDAGAYSLGYSAQTLAFLLFVTDRYPYADPTAMLDGVEPPAEHPVHLAGDPDDLRRSRLTVFFRLLLAIPHIIWLGLWAVAVFFTVIVQWFITLFAGTPAAGLHRFLSKFVRQALHVYAYVSLAANPFPGFAGETGVYPIDLVLPAPGRQNRWKTGFRLVLVIPASIVSSALSGALFAAAVLTWFVALARGSAPSGLRNLSAYALRYGAQVNAYILLITDAYPHASPLEGVAEPQPAVEIAPDAPQPVAG
ncbi:MAG: DUF4389 domain-containing protein [Gaiellaceae bacterium]